MKQYFSGEPEPHNLGLLRFSTGLLSLVAHCLGYLAFQVLLVIHSRLLETQRRSLFENPHEMVSCLHEPRGPPLPKIRFKQLLVMLCLKPTWELLECRGCGKESPKRRRAGPPEFPVAIRR